MAQVLETLTTVTALAAGATTTFVPGLNDAAGVKLIPNVVIPDRSTAIRVVSATALLVTVTNDGTVAETAKFRAQQQFSTSCDPAAAGSQLLWQGLGATSSGGTAGVFKQPVRAATTANLVGTRVGSVLTETGNGSINPLDGVTLVVGDRVLVKNQATGADNGIYDLTDAGSAGTPFVLTRSADADTSAEVKAGMWTLVNEGTVNADNGFELVTDNPITLNTTALTFAKKFVFDLGGTYQNGAAAASQNIVLDTTRGQVQIRDSAATLGSDAYLFTVTDNGGALKNFAVNNGTTGTIQYTYALSSRIGLGPDGVATGLAAATLLVIPPGTLNGALANSEYSDVTFDLSHTVTLPAGLLALERAFTVLAPTYACAGAKTITDVATLAVMGQPIAGGGPVTFTRAFAVLASGAGGQKIGIRNSTTGVQTFNLQCGNTSCSFGYNIDGSLVQDSTAVSSWLLFMDSSGGTDSIRTFYCPAAGAAVAVQTINVSGGLTITQRGVIGAQTLLTLTAGAVTNAASVEAINVLFALNAIQTFAAGALASQRAFLVQAPNYAFNGASAVTTWSTMSISGPPVAGTNTSSVTNAFGLYLATGNVATVAITVTSYIASLIVSAAALVPLTVLAASIRLPGSPLPRG
jgi:hypothetical protein